MAQSAKDQNIASIWLFSECSAREIRSISSVGRELYLIVSGKATVTRKGKTVATLGSGSHFGELSLLDRRPRNATVTSKTDMELFVIGQRQFNALLETIPTLARKLISAMAARMREQDAKAVH